MFILEPKSNFYGQRDPGNIGISKTHFRHVAHYNTDTGDKRTFLVPSKMDLKTGFDKSRLTFGPSCAATHRQLLFVSIGEN